MVGTRRLETLQYHGLGHHRQSVLRLPKERRINRRINRRSAKSRKEQENNVSDRRKTSTELHDSLVETQDDRQRNHENDSVNGPTKYIAHRHGRTATKVHSFARGSCFARHAPKGSSKPGRLFLTPNIQVSNFKINHQTSSETNRYHVTNHFIQIHITFPRTFPHTYTHQNASRPKVQFKTYTHTHNPLNEPL